MAPPSSTAPSSADGGATGTSASHASLAEPAVHLTWFQRRCMAAFKSFGAAAISRGQLRVVFPDGSEFTCGTPTARDPWRAVLRIHDADAIVRIVKDTDIGLGEAYMEGQISSPSLIDVMKVMSANADGAMESDGVLGLLRWVGGRLAYMRHCLRSNTVKNSAKNISYHYDAGNPMYALFMDQTLTYSSGITNTAPSRERGAASNVVPGPGGTLASFPRRQWPLTGPYDRPQLVGAGLAAHGDSVDDLEESQLRKLDEIIARAGLQPGHRVLEIGCGWGSMAIRIAQRIGCRVTGVTLSREQLAVGKARVAAAGVGHLVDLRLQDYRHVEAADGAASYDRVVSCEMLEAVGHEHLPQYFKVVSRVLGAGGRAVIQVISMKNETYARYCAGNDFIREHIFPGGHLPCLHAMDAVANPVGLRRTATLDIGRDYAVTLREWRQRWVARQAEVLDLGYSLEFFRKYEFYFAFCEAAFEFAYIHDFIVTYDVDPSVVDAAVPGAASTGLGAGTLVKACCVAAVAVAVAAAVRSAALR